MKPPRARGPTVVLDGLIEGPLPPRDHNLDVVNKINHETFNGNGDVARITQQLTGLTHQLQGIIKQFNVG